MQTAQYDYNANGNRSARTTSIGTETEVFMATIEELEAKLPNGLHDARLLRLSID